MKLYDYLKKQSENGRIPFHMPGHMRKKFPYLVGEDIDFTEIDGLDDLHAPNGILGDAMDNTARVFGARKAFFLVGGSTVGILSAVYAVANGGKTVVAARNCHKSVYNALTLTGSKVKYIYPERHHIGFSLEITPQSVKSALAETPDAAAVIVTSPTYDGVVSDIKSIAEICHESDVPLIVDAAHGAHLGFLDSSVPSPVKCGADIVVTSLHKTMPSLTQTGLLLHSGNLADEEKIASALGIFETSSPSYILMASIDGCVRSYDNKRLFSDWYERLEKIRRAAENTAVTLTVPQSFAFDESKLIVSAGGYTGAELAEILREKHNIEPEMVSENYVLLLTGAGLGNIQVDSVSAFFASLPKRNEIILQLSNSIPVCESVMTMAEACVRESEDIQASAAVGRVSADMLTPYPPGIPLVVPGEVISSTVVEYIEKLYSEGAKTVTPRGHYDGKIRVLR